MFQPWTWFQENPRTQSSSNYLDLGHIISNEVVLAGTNDGVSAGTAPSDYHEILGAGVNYSYSTVSVSSNNDIVIGSSSGAAKKNWWNNRSPGLGFGNGELTADHYVYVCSSGTGNGTTDATAGKVSITIEYYGID